MESLLAHVDDGDGDPVVVREILDARNDGQGSEALPEGHRVDEGGALLSSEGVRSVEEEGVACLLYTSPSPRD